MWGQNKNWPEPSLQTWRWCRVNITKRLSLISVQMNLFYCVCLFVMMSFKWIFRAGCFSSMKPQREASWDLFTKNRGTIISHLRQWAEGRKYGRLFVTAKGRVQLHPVIRLVQRKLSEPDKDLTCMLGLLVPIYELQVNWCSSTEVICMGLH